MSVDNTMKERTAQGSGVTQSCEVISLKPEDRMLPSGALGEESPEQLLSTIIYTVRVTLSITTWGRTYKIEAIRI